MYYKKDVISEMRDLSAEKQYPDFGQEIEISIFDVKNEIFGEDIS